MTEQAPRRKYELRRRAESVRETRRRITEATVELHGTVGPASTTVSAIAELAGVQRHTVYRHFPDDEQLFAACTAHYWGRHPWPDPQVWSGGDGPTSELCTALGEIYRFYADVEQMMTRVLRDADRMSPVADAVRRYEDYLDGIADGLAARFAPGRAVTVAAVRHAVDFGTWRSLVVRGEMAPEEAARLMLALVQASTG